MTRELIPTEELGHVAEQIDATLGMHIKQAREKVLEGHWLTGQIIRDYCKTNQEKVTLLVKHTSERYPIGETTLFLCVAFFDKFPEFEKVYKLEEGENISWNKVRGLLSPQKKNEEKETDECKHCALHGCPPPRKSIGGGKI